MDKYTKIGEILFELYQEGYSRGYDSIYKPEQEDALIREYLNKIINLEAGND
jgi:hypothetical protein